MLAYISVALRSICYLNVSGNQLNCSHMICLSIIEPTMPYMLDSNFGVWSEQFLGSSFVQQRKRKGLLGLELGFARSICFSKFLAIVFLLYSQRVIMSLILVAYLLTEFFFLLVGVGCVKDEAFYAIQAVLCYQYTKFKFLVFIGCLPYYNLLSLFGLGLLLQKRIYNLGQFVSRIKDHFSGPT